MEKGMVDNRVNRIFFITGAESTGKSTLTAQLAGHFGAIGVPEYARTYLETLNRPYQLEDVERIAKGQIDLIYQYRNRPLVFFDTCLFILKVWFKEVYQTVPDWLEREIPLIGKGIYLLCEPDLPWQYDPLRENPTRRDYLNKQYEEELQKAGFSYFRVSGNETARTQNAIEIINRMLIC